MSNVTGIPLSAMTDEQLVIYLGQVIQEVCGRDHKTFNNKSITYAATGESVTPGEALQDAGYLLIAHGKDIEYEEIERKRRDFYDQ